MRIAASILFDSNYIEPALVTAHQLIELPRCIRGLYLVFLAQSSPEDQEARTIIGEFRARFSGAIPIHTIELRNSLPAFASFHYTNSIVYKPIIPSVVGNEPYIINIDPGTLPGRRFEAFVAQLEETLCRDDATWIIAAHCVPVEEKLRDPSLLNLPHNRFYPWGNALLFNTVLYEPRNWYRRYIGNYLQWRSLLKSADEELICLTALEGELIPLPESDRMVYPILGGGALDGIAQRLPSDSVEESVYFKFGGSFKPWKYWVLDPNKAIYLRKRGELEQSFPLSGIPLIERNRISAIRKEWPVEFQKAYEVYIQRTLS